MTTIVNNPAPQDKTGGVAGMIAGLIALVVLVFIFFNYGLPAIRNIKSPQINIPDKVDININQQSK